MDTKTMETLWARLISRDNAVRQAAREEVQSWSYETVVRLLYTYGPEGYDLPLPKPTSLLERVQRRFAPTNPSLMTTLMLDTLVSVCADSSEDVRFVGLILSILANEQRRKDEAEARLEFFSL